MVGVDGHGTIKADRGIGRHTYCNRDFERGPPGEITEIDAVFLDRHDRIRTISDGNIRKGSVHDIVEDGHGLGIVLPETGADGQLVIFDPGGNDRSEDDIRVVILEDGSAAIEPGQVDGFRRDDQPFEIGLTLFIIETFIRFTAGGGERDFEVFRIGIRIHESSWL